MMLYDMRMEHFNRHGILMGQKGMDLISIDSERYEEAYEMLKKSIEEEKDGSDSPVIYTYMVVTKTMFDNGKIPAETVIETYALLADYLDEQIKANPDDNRCVQVKENVDALFSSAGVADCNNLTEIFESRIDSNPDDVELIKKTHSLLSANRCEGTDFYQKTVIKLFDKEPESMLAYEIAKIFTGLRDYQKAEKYFKQAIELEKDAIRKSVFLVEYAGIIFNEFNSPEKARTVALKALSENPNMGHAYILIGNIYAAEKNCFDDDFKKKTVYWAAVDKFAKAKQVDPTLADDCDRLIDVYKQYFPAQNDIFFQDLQPNQSYSVGCWINETTTVRARP
jgi:tetratricopeptide (TPR) repeat protein